MLKVYKVSKISIENDEISELAYPDNRGLTIDEIEEMLESPAEAEARAELSHWQNFWNSITDFHCKINCWNNQNDTRRGCWDFWELPY